MVGRSMETTGVSMFLLRRVGGFVKLRLLTKVITDLLRGYTRFTLRYLQRFGSMVIYGGGYRSTLTTLQVCTRSELMFSTGVNEIGQRVKGFPVVKVTLLRVRFTFVSDILIET